MQKTPLCWILILVMTATYLSVRGQKSPMPTPAKETQAITPPPEKPTQTSAPEPAASAPPAAIVARAWPHTHSDIPADPKAVFGSLPNGMRYVVYPNAEPPGRVSLRLHIDAGSLMEAEDQRGVAHFLEHMMFNGTQHYSADELVPRMQRLGIAFGAHANAYTSFDETVYMLDLPDLAPETMDLGFTVMRDFGDGALLQASEIEKERGVILAEKTSRDNVEVRIMEQQFKTLLPHSLIPNRFPIGEESVIRSAPQNRFKDFYTQYYTPSRMTFVVVGDINPETVRKQIESTFESMRNPETPGNDPDFGKVTPPEGIQTSVFQDPELTSTDVSLLLTRPHSNEPDNRAERGKDIDLEIAHAIIDRRFERLSKADHSPVASGSISRSNLFNHLELGSISITAADDRWQEVVAVIEQEFRRALLYGFTDAELNEAKANILNAYQQRVEQKATQKSEKLASSITHSINDESVLSDPETDLQIATDALARADATTCLNAFKSFWKASGYHLVLTTKNAPQNAAAELASLHAASAKIALEAPTAKAIEVFDYTDFGKPGKITSSMEVSDLGITQLLLSNNVRINLKRTEYEKGKIRVMARIGSGKLSQPKNKPMLDAFAQAVFEGGGLGKHSNDALQRILAGRNVSSTLMIDEDAFVLTGSTTPADFLTQCQYMCASLTDPGFRKEGLWQFQKAVPMLEQQLKHTPAGPQKEFDAWLHGGDSRFAIATGATLSSYTIEEAKQWLVPELSNGQIELSIVGDFDPSQLQSALLETFGALPKRAAAAPNLNDSRAIRFPNAPASKSFGYESKIPQAIATAVWKTVPMRGHMQEFRRLNLLASILEDRLREEIREKLGASYSPNAAATGSDAFENTGYLISQSIGKPEDTELLLNTMREIAEQLSIHGATQDEFDRAQKPLLSILDKTERDNQYWLKTVLSRCQSEPTRLELARSRSADYRSITLHEVNALAKKYLSAENAIVVTIKPH